MGLNYSSRDLALASGGERGAPGHTKHDGALWLGEPLHGLEVLWMPTEHGGDGVQDLIHGLEELVLIRVPLPDALHQALHTTGLSYIVLQSQ